MRGLWGASGETGPNYWTGFCIPQNPVPTLGKGVMTDITHRQKNIGWYFRVVASKKAIGISMNASQTKYEGEI